MDGKPVFIVISARSTDDLIDIAPSIALSIREGDGGTLKNVRVEVRVFAGWSDEEMQEIFDGVLERISEETVYRNVRRGQ